MTEARTGAGGADHWAEAEPGSDLLAAGDVEGAVATLTEIVRSNPQNEYAFYFLGNALFEQGAWERALKAYVTALGLAPDYLGAMVGAGHCLRELGRTTEAVRMAQEVLRRAKDDPDAHYLLGTTYFRRGEDPLARRHLEAFLATRPAAEVSLEVRGMLEVLGGHVLDGTPDDDTVN